MSSIGVSQKTHWFCCVFHGCKQQSISFALFSIDVRQIRFDVLSIDVCKKHGFAESSIDVSQKAWSLTFFYRCKSKSIAVVRCFP